jgi:small-conductance mechanosensitive channel
MNVIELAQSFVPLLLTALCVFGLLYIAHRFLIVRHRDQGSEYLFSRQIWMLVFTVAGLIAITLALPVGDSTRNQIIGLIGLVISGVFAFASTNIFSNLAAGLLLRVTKPFALGDFITVAGHFGRVSERGLFDTELASDSGELIALPNTLLISSPVHTIPASRALVSATVSLGYDVHHDKIIELLKEAAEKCELASSFVQVLSLGDFSINYRISGVLQESKGIITARSELHRSMLNTLHKAGIEIVSPNFMNQRPLKDGLQFIPVQPRAKKTVEEASDAESVLFEKAEVAKQREDKIVAIKVEIADLTVLKDSAEGEEKAALKEQISSKEAELQLVLETKPEEMQIEDSTSGVVNTEITEGNKPKA